MKSFSITDVSVFFTVSFTDIRNCVEFYISTIKSFILTLCVICFSGSLVCSETHQNFCLVFSE